MFVGKNVQDTQLFATQQKSGDFHAPVKSYEPDSIFADSDSNPNEFHYWVLNRDPWVGVKAKVAQNKKIMFVVSRIGRWGSS